ncbi:hypothetical protein Tco_0026335 [Tanacetum coccineum]
MITTNNRIEGRKPSGPMLLPQLKTMGMLDPILCVRDALTSQDTTLTLLDQPFEIDLMRIKLDGRYQKSVEFPKVFWRSYLATPVRSAFQIAVIQGAALSSPETL